MMPSELENKNTYSKAIILSILAYIVFSFSDGVRKVWSSDYTVIDILFWQSLLAIIFLILISPFMGGAKNMIFPHNIKWHITRGVLMATNTSLSLMAISQVPIMDAYTIFFLTPFCVSILAVFLFKEKIGKYRLASIALGFIGALIAFRPGFVELNPAYLFALSAVFTFSSASLIARFLGHGNGLLTYAFWPLFILCTAIFTLKSGQIESIPSIEFLGFMLLAGIAYSLALMTIAYSFSLAPAAVVAPYQYTQIIFALSFGYAFFGTVPDMFRLIGSAIIVGSGIFFFARERHLKKLAQSNAPNLA